MYILGIETFIAVVHTHSLTGAAELLHLAQSTISNRLQVLEREVGGPLIERSKGNKEIRLTPMGESFLSIAERYNELWEETRFLHQSGPQLRLSIGAVDSVNTYLMPIVYQALYAHTPRIKLQIRTQQSSELYEQTERRVIDTAFVLHERASKTITVKPYFAEPMVVLRAMSQAANYPAVIQAEQLDTADELYIHWSPDFQIWHDNCWDSLRQIYTRVDSISLLLTLLKNPRQWAIVPLSAARLLANSGNYVFQRITTPPPDRVCYQITHKYPSPLAKESLNILQQYSALIEQAAI
jgi:DNA-binding transcriptional LysR family regulator